MSSICDRHVKDGGICEAASRRERRRCRRKRNRAGKKPGRFKRVPVIIAAGNFQNQIAVGRIGIDRAVIEADTYAGVTRARRDQPGREVRGSAANVVCAAIPGRRIDARFLCGRGEEARAMIERIINLIFMVFVICDLQSCFRAILGKILSVARVRLREFWLSLRQFGI